MGAVNLFRDDDDDRLFECFNALSLGGRKVVIYFYWPRYIHPFCWLAAFFGVRDEIVHKLWPTLGRHTFLTWSTEEGKGGGGQRSRCAIIQRLAEKKVAFALNLNITLDAEFAR